MRFKSKDSFSYEEFKSPSKEYRGVPFWSWNCSLSEDKIKKQLAVFEEMGFGGAIAHSRNGLEDEYLGEKFMDMISLSSDVSEERDLDLWLYDEDRWPSGSAGGIVTLDNLEYRQKNILFTKKNAEELPASKGYFSRLVASFAIELDDHGYLANYRFAKAGEDAIHVYEMIAPDNPRYNGGANVDTLSREAVAAFIESTYEKYKRELGDSFGKRVSSIFTDEPQTDKKFPAPVSDVKNFEEASFPWTSDLAESYQKEYGEDIVACLPELVFELSGGRYSRARYRYHEHLSARFRQAYTKQIGDWCRANGINFTGHLLLEESIAAQTKCVGDISRCYTDFDIPGIDVLCAKYEYTTAKQAQSVARQDGKPWVMSELYGVTGWQSDFRDYKHWGDWQAALGITIRVPHLNWMSMLGGGKRDYPACFGYQAPWYKRFAEIEDYFARLHTVLTAGVPKVNIGVIHPIESFWLCYGPLDKTGEICRDRNNAFLDLAEWLLFSGNDFDYLNESLLPSQYVNGAVGKMRYETVIVPDCITLRESTVKVLEDMKERGVRVIFAGRIPTHIDGGECDLASRLAEGCERVEFSREAVVAALDKERSFKLLGSDGASEDYISHTRIIDGDRWLLLVPAKHIADKEDTSRKKLTLELSGKVNAVLYDAMSGERRTPAQKTENGKTKVELSVCSYDSILLCIKEGVAEEARLVTRTERRRLARILDADIKREEPNVLLVDMAEYSFDGENYLGVEEILRIDTAAREKYGLPTIMGKFAYQPWAIRDDVKRDVWIKATFESLSDFECELAFERADGVWLNGEAADMTPCGYYVDEDIKRIKLPMVREGSNELVVKLNIGKIYGVEPMYILGDFDVELRGIEKTLIPSKKRIGFDSIVNQGMPFYSGNVLYSFDVETPAGDLVLEVGKYRGALVGVRIDGEEQGSIIMPPYSLKIKGVTAGKHHVELCLYGNRHNTFGSLHCAVNDIYYGPTHWQKDDGEFIYEYQLRDMGIMKSPEIFIEE